VGIDNISTLFEAAGQGRLKLHTAGLSYVDNNEQVLKFTGWHADGTPFAFVSAPFASDPHTRAIQVAHDLIVAHTGKPAPMSLLGKLNALTERAQDFTKATGDSLDALSEKIVAAERKRETAMQKHHAYYDAIGKGIDESVAVIDRLSNGPLDGSSSS
jgi:hypothetical protein